MRKVLIVSLIGLFVGVSSFYLKDEFSRETHTPGLAKTFDSVEEIKSDATLIVRAHIPNTHTIIEVPAKIAVYAIKINEVIKNDTGLEISKNQIINYTQAVAFKDISTGKFIEVLSDEEVNLQAGEYLLFLKNTKIENKTYFVNNSPYYLHKWRGNKTFENIRSDQLDNLNVDDVME